MLLKRSEMWLKTKITKIRNLIDELKSRLQKTYGETIKRIHLISITERRKKGRKEEVREGKGRKNPTQGRETQSHKFMSDSLWSHGLYTPWNSTGQNIGVGSHSLLQGIFPTQGSNPGLTHCRQILYQLNHQGSPREL